MFGTTQEKQAGHLESEVFYASKANDSDISWSLLQLARVGSQVRKKNNLNGWNPWSNKTRKSISRRRRTL